MVKQEVSENRLCAEYPESLTDDGPHARFRDLCLLYGDFNRPVFLEEIGLFVRRADGSELAVIRAAVSKRAKCFNGRNRRGRPRACDDEKWKEQALKEVWQRIVLGWTWPRIAESAGMHPTKPNIRTFQRRHEEFAALLWRALPPHQEGVEKVLANPYVRRLLRSKLGLPFDSNPEECQKVVVALASRGLKAATAPTLRILRKAPKH